MAAAVMAARRRSAARPSMPELGHDGIHTLAVGAIAVQRERVFSAKRIQRWYRAFRIKSKYARRVRPMLKVLSRLDRAKKAIDFKDGFNALIYHLFVCFVFFFVISLQKSTYTTWQTNKLIQEALEGLEWSHGNTYKEMANMGGDPELSQQNQLMLWVKEFVKLTHQSADLNRKSVEELLDHYDTFNPDMTRNLTFEDLIGQPFEVRYLRVIGGENPPPLGSNSIGPPTYRYNFTLPDVTALDAVTQSWVGRYYRQSNMPAACRALSNEQAAGLDAYNRGIDFLPKTPVYGFHEPTGGYIFGNGKVIGMLEIRQTRRNNTICADLNKNNSVAVQCRDDSVDSTDNIRPFSLTFGPGRTADCSRRPEYRATSSSTVAAAPSSSSSSSSSTADTTTTTTTTTTNATSSSSSSSSSSSTSSSTMPEIVDYSRVASDANNAALFADLQKDHPYDSDGIEPFCYDHNRKAYYARFDLGLYAFPLEVVLCQLELLESERWLDHTTKQLMTRLIIFNPDTQLYTQLVMTYDIMVGGYVWHTFNVNSIPIRDMYSQPADIFRLFFELVYVILTIIYIVQAILDFRRMGWRKFFSDGGNVVNTTGLVMTIVNIALWLQYVARCASFRPAVGSETLRTAFVSAADAHEEFGRVYDAAGSYKISNSISIVLMMIRLFMFFRFHQRLAIVTSTVSRIWTEIWQLAIIFLLATFAVTFLAWNSLGEYMWDFHSLPWTFHTVIDASFGDMPDYETMWRKENLMGPFIYYMMNFLMAIFFMNVILAIMLDGFMAVKEGTTGGSVLETASETVRVWKEMRAARRQAQSKSVVVIPSDPYKVSQAAMEAGAAASKTIDDIADTTKFTASSAREVKRAVLLAIKKTLEEQLGDGEDPLSSGEGMRTYENPTFRKGPVEEKAAGSDGLAGIAEGVKEFAEESPPAVLATAVAAPRGTFNGETDL